MGITIIQKSDTSVRKRDPKVALVLAGGAVTGGAFKLGGLKALDDYLEKRKRLRGQMEPKRLTPAEKKAAKEGGGV